MKMVHALKTLLITCAFFFSTQMAVFAQVVPAKQLTKPGSKRVQLLLKITEKTFTKDASPRATKMAKKMVNRITKHLIKKGDKKLPHGKIEKRLASLNNDLNNYMPRNEKEAQNLASTKQMVTEMEQMMKESDTYQDLGMRFQEKYNQSSVVLFLTLYFGALMVIVGLYGVALSGLILFSYIIFVVVYEWHPVNANGYYQTVPVKPAPAPAPILVIK